MYMVISGIHERWSYSAIGMRSIMMIREVSGSFVVEVLEHTDAKLVDKVK